MKSITPASYTAGEFRMTKLASHGGEIYFLTHGEAGWLVLRTSAAGDLAASFPLGREPVDGFDIGPEGNFWVVRGKQASVYD